MGVSDMGLFANSVPPNLPLPTKEYDAAYVNRLLGVLRLYFTGLSAVQHISISSLNLNVATLPTEADIATLRSGDVYRDSTAANVLKVKV